jgi:hypothetical protein
MRISKDVFTIYSRTWYGRTLCVSNMGWEVLTVQVELINNIHESRLSRSLFHLRLIIRHEYIFLALRRRRRRWKLMTEARTYGWQQPWCTSNVNVSIKKEERKEVGLMLFRRCVVIMKSWDGMCRREGLFACDARRSSSVSFLIIFAQELPLSFLVLYLWYWPWLDIH